MIYETILAMKTKMQNIPQNIKEAINNGTLASSMLLCMSTEMNVGGTLCGQDKTRLVKTMFDLLLFDCLCAKYGQKDATSITYRVLIKLEFFVAFRNGMYMYLFLLKYLLHCMYFNIFILE